MPRAATAAVQRASNSAHRRSSSSVEWPTGSSTICGRGSMWLAMAYTVAAGHHVVPARDADQRGAGDAVGDVDGVEVAQRRRRRRLQAGVPGQVLVDFLAGIRASPVAGVLRASRRSGAPRRGIPRARSVPAPASRARPRSSGRGRPRRRDRRRAVAPPRRPARSRRRRRAGWRCAGRSGRSICSRGNRPGRRRATARSRVRRSRTDRRGRSWYDAPPAPDYTGRCSRGW